MTLNEIKQILLDHKITNGNWSNWNLDYDKNKDQDLNWSLKNIMDLKCTLYQNIESILKKYNHIG